MATGGYDRSVDSRVVCSVCLEPCRGRQPKLLPCFHTFCMPCLSQLAQKNSAQITDTERPETGEGGQKPDGPSLTITCPTCRNIIHVPPGGVEDFQSNFVDDDATAVLNSPESNYAAVTVAMATRNSDPTSGDLQQKVKSHVRVMEAALAQLAEEEGEITRQRRALDHDIQTRYAAALRHLADARDQSLISLRDTAQAALDKVEVETSHAKIILQSMSHVDTADTSQHFSHVQQAGLPSDATLRHFQQISQQKGSKTYFFYSANDSPTPALIDSCTQFMGTVLPVGKASDLTVGANMPPKGVDAAKGVDAEYLDLISNANLHHSVTTLQANVEKPQQNLITNLQLDVTALQCDVGRLQQSLTALETENARLMDYIQDKMLTENTRLDAGLLAVKEEFGNLRQDFDSVKKLTGQEMTAIKGDLATSQRERGSLEKTVATLQDLFAKGAASVAFHASVGASMLTNKGCVIKCDKIWINVGGGYNPQTGIFTAPVSGTYIFMATTSPARYKHSSCGIIVNGEKMARTRSEGCGGHSDSRTSSTAHVVVYVTKGQQVFIETEANSSIRGEVCAFFSGALLHPTL